MHREPRIRAPHLERLAVVYVRQSTPGQVRENRESTRLQYKLRERAELLGWPRERIETIDEDLGCSGAGDVERRGYARLVRSVARGKVGAVFGLDASRFARNGADWFELLRWLRATETLLVTDKGVYDPRSGDDSFVLGMHGTLSDAELYKIKARMEEGKLNKARRGELYVAVPTGFVVDGKRLRKDPDRDVQEALEAVFARFRELGSAWQVAKQLRAEGMRLPTRHGDARGLEWRKTTYSRVRNVLKHPAMGGAYTWGRTRTKLQLDERDRKRKTTRKLPMEEWRVLIEGHHEGYVEWQEWLAIQQRLAGNQCAQGGPGAAREGRALLQGLAICGHCGRRMQVRYKSAVQYRCAPAPDGEGGCQYLGGKRLDRLVAEVVLEALRPAAVEAAAEAERLREEEWQRQLLGFRREVERKEWEERKARKEYLEVEPEFRRVKRTLARDWERAQAELERAQVELEGARKALQAAGQGVPAELSAAERQELAACCEDLRAVWEHEATTWRDRKLLLGAVMEEVVLTADRKAGRLRVLLRWQGGWIDERELPLAPKPEVQRTPEATVELIRRLAQFHHDPQVAAELRRRGVRTARGLEFTWRLVASVRSRYGIPGCRRKPAGGPEPVSVQAAARELGVSASSLYRWIAQGWVPAEREGPEGALRVRLDASVREKFCALVPEGYVRARTAARELGVSRQTIWLRVREGSLQALRVVRGAEKGLYVRLDSESPALLPGMEPADEDSG